MVLGVTCSSSVALLTGVRAAELVELPVHRIEVVSNHEASAGLEAMLREAQRALSQIGPEHVVLLLPERSERFKYTYTKLAPRVTLETIFRLACVRSSIPIDLMARATVRAKLKLPKTGDLQSHVHLHFPEAIGPYWKAGRDVAAMAALAGEVANAEG